MAWFLNLVQTVQSDRVNREPFMKTIFYIQEPLERRSNLKNRSNRNPVQPNVCEKNCFPIWNSGMDLKWEKKNKKRKWWRRSENEAKNIRGTDGMIRFKKKKKDEMSRKREEEEGDGSKSWCWETV